MSLPHVHTGNLGKVAGMVLLSLMLPLLLSRRLLGGLLAQGLTDGRFLKPHSSTHAEKRDQPAAGLIAEEPPWQPQPSRQCVKRNVSSVHAPIIRAVSEWTWGVNGLGRTCTQHGRTMIALDRANSLDRGLLPAWVQPSDFGS